MSDGPKILNVRDSSSGSVHRFRSFSTGLGKTDHQKLFYREVGCLVDTIGAVVHGIWPELNTSTKYFEEEVIFGGRSDRERSLLDACLEPQAILLVSQK